MLGVQVADVHAAVGGPGHGPGRPLGDVHGQGVEEVPVLQGQAGRLQPGGQVGGLLVDPRGDGGQPLGAVVDAVHGGDDRQEGLGGADVRGGLLTADVLLAGLEGQAQGGGAVAVP